MRRFDGDFTGEFRELLKQRRREAGYCYRELGEMLRVSASTVQKWEKGMVLRCREQYVSRIAEFLHCDHAQFHDAIDKCASMLKLLPVQFTTQLANAALVYRRLPRGEKRAMMAKELDSLSHECLVMLETP